MKLSKVTVALIGLCTAAATLATNLPQPPELFDKKSGKKNLWGYSSEGREMIEVLTDDGQVIRAVDVDGLAHAGDVILGYTADLKKHGLRMVQGEDAPEDDFNRAAIRYPSSGYKWPNGTVPYVLDGSLGTNGQSAMNYAFNHWNTYTNLNFVPRTNQSNYIRVVGGGGCSSWIGMQGGSQTVTLAEGCGNGAAVHELGHAVGFFHEQTRADRDSYVTIYWNNIQSGMSYNFDKMTSSDGQTHGSYDYRSIMHYRTTAFGINNAVTIWPKQDGVDTSYMGNGSVLSSGDIAAAAAIYSSGGGSGGGTNYSGSLTGANDSDIQPDGNWFQYNGGTLQSTLSGPSNADFDLSLHRWNGSAWSEVAKSESSSSNESISYNASSGYYYFKVYSYSGSGSYSLNISQ
jgi:hypothetical protein